MIELRWVTHYHYNGVGEQMKILQYRQKIDNRVYAGLGQPFPGRAELVWSDWKEVPEVKYSSLDLGLASGD